jgi:hypothetical protein
MPPDRPGPAEFNAAMNCVEFGEGIVTTMLSLLLVLAALAVPAQSGRTAGLPALVRLAKPGEAALAGSAAGSNALNVKIVGSIGGSVQAVDVDGSNAYIGEGPDLVILDVADPRRTECAVTRPGSRRGCQRRLRLRGSRRGRPAGSGRARPGRTR